MFETSSICSFSTYCCITHCCIICDFREIANFSLISDCFSVFPNLWYISKRHPFWKWFSNHSRFCDFRKFANFSLMNDCFAVFPNLWYISKRHLFWKSFSKHSKFIFFLFWNVPQKATVWDFWKFATLINFRPFGFFGLLQVAEVIH